MKYLYGLVFLLLSATAAGQRTVEWSKSSLHSPAETAPLFTLPYLSLADLRVEDLVREQNGDFYRIGVATQVLISPETHGVWTSDGNQHQWTLRIRTENGTGLSFIFGRFALAPESSFQVYDQSGKPVYEEITSRDNADYGGRHIELCAGNELTLVLTTLTPHTDVVELNRIFQIYRELNTPEKEYGDAGDCEINVNCSPVGDNWQDEKRGVARILLVMGSNLGYCTGSLINNADQDCKPYFLTAQHCGVGASQADLNQWKFYFGYESPGCTNSNPGTSSSKRIDGATQVSASAGVTQQGITSSDFMLLKLGAPTNELQTVTKLKSSAINAYWNGWDATGNPASQGVGIHHPAGDIKKISTFSSALVSTNYPGSGVSGTHWRVNWTANANGWGVTEGGSSGSPIFSFNGGQSRIVGTLSGGEADCSSLSSPDYYGKFSYHWQSNGSVAQRQLRPFLDPSNLGLLVLDGSGDPCASLVANFSASPTTAAPGDVIQFTDETSGNPTAWQWSVFPSTGWTSTSGTTSNSQNPQILFTAQGQYSVKLIASNNLYEDSIRRDNYITITFATSPCLASAINCDEFISQVQLNTIDQISDCNHYTLFQNGTNLSPGGYYTLSVTPQIGNFPGTAYNGDEIAAWIDYNGDFDFEDADEQIAYLYISGTFNSAFDFIVPATALPGPKIMRVRLAFNSGANPIQPCGTTEYGEVEDYPVFIEQQLGLSEIGLAELELYPNPAKASVEIRSPLYGKLTLLDARGQIITTLTHAGHSMVDISGLAAGVYHVMLQSPEGTVSRKLVKL